MLWTDEQKSGFFETEILGGFGLKKRNMLKSISCPGLSMGKDV